MSRTHTIIKGTLVLTITGLITRFMGFFYRIFLSHTFGEDGVGLYQLVFPVFALGFSLTSAGIELSLSRCVSKYFALGNKKRAREMLYTSIIFSLSLSIVISLLLQKNAYFLSQYFLQNPDTEDLLILLSYIFPFAGIHSCIIGYYLGMKQTKIPAISQFLEQCARILSVFFIYRLSTVFSFKFTISFAVLGLIIGEIASGLFCIKTITGKFLPTTFPALSFRTFSSCIRELLALSLPVTASRVSLNLLQSIEATSIPLSLVTYGHSTNEALSIYGVLSGMALPCILFPSAITNAISTMLLPTVAEIQTLHNQIALNKLLKKTLSSCIFLGIVCCICFQLFGNLAGVLLFHSELAGNFIITLAWMCPFLYSNNTLISTINGMGRTGISFLINVLGLSVRILSVLSGVPSLGIYAYLIGLLISQVLIFILSFIFLIKQFKAEVH